MFSSIIEHVVVFFDDKWERYPTLRPSIQAIGHIWRISIKFLRFLVQKRVLASYHGRQPFKICYTNINPVREFLKSGFVVNELSLKDTDEISTIRKIVDKIYQIHIRIYSPPENPELAKRYAFEIGGHLEYAWDYHPLKHWKAELMKPAHEEALNILKANGVDYVEADRATEQLELEKHLEWIREKLNYAKSLRGGRSRTTKKSRK